MINWTYKSEDFKINNNTLIPEGDHRVMVSRVTIKTYSSGNDGFEIMLDVSGYPGKLWHRIIMDPTNPEKTNHHLGKFFESFGITNYDLNHYEDWVGKEGAVRVKHDNYEENTSAKVIFCITRAYQGKLPAWRDAYYDINEDNLQEIVDYISDNYEIPLAQAKDSGETIDEALLELAASVITEITTNPEW